MSINCLHCGNEIHQNECARHTDAGLYHLRCWDRVVEAHVLGYSNPEPKTDLRSQEDFHSSPAVDGLTSVLNAYEVKAYQAAKTEEVLAAFGATTGTPILKVDVRICPQCETYQPRDTRHCTICGETPPSVAEQLVSVGDEQAAMLRMDKHGRLLYAGPPIPYKCPVCEGHGQERPTGVDNLHFPACPTCKGLGIVWSTEAPDQENS